MTTFDKEAAKQYLAFVGDDSPFSERHLANFLRDAIAALEAAEAEARHWKSQHDHLLAGVKDLRRAADALDAAERLAVQVDRYYQEGAHDRVLDDMEDALADYRAKTGGDK